MRVRIIGAALLLLGAVVGGVALVDDPDRPRATLQQAPRYVHDGSDRDRVVDGFYDVWLRNQRAPFEWDGDVGDCRPGRVSDATRSSTLSQINYFREMAGLRSVGLVDDLDPVVQRTALIMDANQALSHDPPEGWSCRTRSGARLAGRSNLALGSAGRGAQAITQYVLDPGRRNRQVGHRRWLFAPRTARVATGSTARANAVAVVGMPQHRRRVPTWIPWPSRGYFPSPLEPAGRWSLSTSRGRTDFSRARVRVVGPGGERLPVREMRVRHGMGPTTLVWRVRGLTRPTRSQDAVHRVRVSRVRRGGRRLRPVRWTVRLVLPDRSVVSTDPPEVSGRFVPGGAVYVHKGSWSPQPTAFHYQWLRDGRPITGETRSFYQVRAEDRGHTVSARVSATAPWYVAGVATAGLPVPAS